MAVLCTLFGPYEYRLASGTSFTAPAATDIKSTCTLAILTQVFCADSDTESGFALEHYGSHTTFHLSVTTYTSAYVFDCCFAHPISLSSESSLQSLCALLCIQFSKHPLEIGVVILHTSCHNSKVDAFTNQCVHPSVNIWNDICHSILITA